MSMDAESFRSEIIGLISASIQNHCSDQGIESMWREPLVGFADALSPLFAQLKDIAYCGHRVPEDFLPNARIVISYFLPFTEDIGRSNVSGTEPSAEWVSTYRTTNGMASGINDL